jgi:hypothetical protein
MHRALEVDEIVQAIVAGVGDPSDPVSRTALARLATTNRTFSMAALDTLWRTLSDQMLFALIQTIPPDYWTWRLTPDAESEYYKYAHRTLVSFSFTGFKPFPKSLILALVCRCYYR